MPPSGYTNAQYSVTGRDTSGRSEAGHIAAYGRQDFGVYYVAGVFDTGFCHNTTGRIGLDSTLNSSFSGTEVLGRVEGGRLFAFAPGDVTPFVAFQAAGLFNDGFTETGSGSAALHVSGKTVDSEKLDLGAQFDTTRAFGNGMVLTPYARLAWEHEFNTNRSISASLVSLPGSGFNVAGTPAVSDAARVTAGAQLDLSRAVAAFVAFDGALSPGGNLYSGKGGVRVTW